VLRSTISTYTPAAATFTAQVPTRSNAMRFMKSLMDVIPESKGRLYTR
jgi:hypothetical protein